MIKQEITYYLNTFKIKSYKEFHGDNLIIHTKYDENNNKVYLYLAYEDLEWERKFEEGAKNDTGCVLYYKDNKGNLTYEINGLIFKINKTQNDYYDISVTDKNASLVNLIMLHAKAKLIDGIYYCYVFTETLKNGDKLVYNSNYFNEIYYEYWDEVESHSLNINQENKYSGKRTLINFNLLLDISQFRTFFIENNISPVNKNYVVGNPNYYY
jgi:hypothetical protein